MKASSLGLVAALLYCATAAAAENDRTVRMGATSGQTGEGKVVAQSDQDIVMSASGHFPLPRASIQSIVPIDDGAPTSAQRSAPGAQSERASGKLRLHGSNTIGARLAPDLASAFGRANGFLAERESPGPNDEERTIEFHEAESSRELQIEIQAHGSATAFPDLAAGQTDIGMASRKVLPPEIDALIKAGVGDPSKPGNENVIALDGIAVIVNPGNSAPSLTLSQFRDLMTGVVTNWSTVGGPDLAVHVYSRDSKSGTFEIIKQKSLGDDGKIAASAKLFQSNEDLADAVAADPAGIGFVGLAYVRSAKPLPIQPACALPAAAPDEFTVKTEEYPLARRLYFYVGDQRAPLSQSFLDFALSGAGDKVAEADGFVGLRPSLASTDYSQSAAARVSRGGGGDAIQANLFSDAVRGARRLSITFRFDYAKATPDSRAVEDAKRLKDWIQSDAAGRAITLVGHASADGDYRANVALSQQRASEIAKIVGVDSIKTLGVGPVAPVVCDGGKLADNNLNRRVEVWVR